MKKEYQLFDYLLKAENKKFVAKSKKEYWKRHENIAEELQGIIYDSRKVTGSGI